MASRPTLRRSSSCVILSLLLLTIGCVLAPPASAVQTQHPIVVSDNPANWTPNILDGQVNAILQMGSKVIVGGTFTQVQAAGSAVTLTRNSIFAFDMNTGVIDQGFVPQLNGQVEALAPGPDGGSVFVGGSFGSVNGNTGLRRLARLNLANGQAVAGFQPNPATSVLALVVRGPWLYVSGSFQQIGDVSRSAIARLNPVSGAVDAGFNVPFTTPQNGGGLNVRKFDVTPNGSRLVAIGNFSQVGGLPRNQIAMVDLTTTPPSVSSWQTDQVPFFVPNTTTTWCSPAFSTYMRDVDISPDGSYFILVTTGAYRANRLCDSVSRWEVNATGPGRVPTWVDWAGGDTFWGVGTTGAAVYAGGHPRWMNNPYRSDDAGPGAVPREGIASLDPVNGLPFTWDPGRARGVGTFDIVGTPDGLFVGSDTERFGGEARLRIAFLPLTGGTLVPPNVPYGLPNDLYRIDEATSTFTRRPFDGTTFGPVQTPPTGVNWGTTRGAFALNGRLYTGQSNGTLTWRNYDGTTVGGSNTVNLFGLNVAPPTTFLIPGTNTPVPAFSTHLASMTGMFFDGGRIYYTVSGNPRLYYRYFTPESLVVGANLFVAGTAGPIDWANVRRMTMASGNLYYALANGNLFRVPWVAGQPSGTPTQIGGPAVDGVNWASRGLFAFSGSNDTTPPTAPGRPTGSSSGFDSIDLTWSAANDASRPLTYRIYRDGSPTAFTTLQSASTTTVSFSDTGLVAGSTHTYRVDAMDPSGNVGPMSPSSDPITVDSAPGAIFTDDFSSGSLTSWTGSTQFTIDGAIGGNAPPSAHAQVTGQPAFLTRDLGVNVPNACLAVAVNAASLNPGGPMALLQLQTATGGAIARVFANPAGTLFVKSDVSLAQTSSGVALGTGWHTIEFCVTVGGSGTLNLYRDGTRIVNAFAANTGSTQIGRIVVGDTAAKTFTVNIDDVVVDQAPG